MDKSYVISGVEIYKGGIVARPYPMPVSVVNAPKPIQIVSTPATQLKAAGNGNSK